MASPVSHRFRPVAVALDTDAHFAECAADGSTRAEITLCGEPVDRDCSMERFRMRGCRDCLARAFANGLSRQRLLGIDRAIYDDA